MIVPVLLLVGVAGLPPHGAYQVRTDSADISYPIWDALCGEKTLAPETFEAKTVVYVKHYDDGKKFWIDGGPDFRLGTDLCFGENPSLEVTTRDGAKDEWTTSCASTRAAQGTETTAQRFVQSGRDLVVRYVQTRDVRRRRSRCVSTLKRYVVLEQTSSSVAAGQLPSAPARKPTPTTFSQRSIEADLEAELKALSNDVVHLEVLHRNQLDKNFMPVKAEYLLDGKPVLPLGGSKIPLVMNGKGATTVVESTIATGSHTLEVKLSYKFKANANVFDVVVIDRTFFDAMPNKPASITVDVFEDSSIWKEKMSSAKVKFHVKNGAKPNSSNR